MGMALFENKSLSVCIFLSLSGFSEAEFLCVALIALKLAL